MAFMIEFGFSIPRYKKYTLFNRGIVNTTEFGLGLVTIYRFDVRHLHAFCELLETNSQWGELIIKHAPQLRLYRQKITAKARKQAEADYKERMEYWKQGYDKFYSKAQSLESKNRKLQTTIDVLTKKLAGDL